MAQADAFIKDKAVPVPQAVFFGDFLKIIEDPALQVEDRVYPFMAQKCR